MLDKFSDLIITEDEEELVVLNDNPFSTASVEKVISEINLNGTTEFWKNQLQKWKNEGRI